MTSVAQLMRTDIFRAGITGDSRASNRKSPWESGGMKEEGALRCFDLINQDGNTSVPLCVHMRVDSAKERWEVGGWEGWVPRFDVKMLTLSFVLVTCF